jgi:hypothetical protein
VVVADGRERKEEHIRPKLVCVACAVEYNELNEFLKGVSYLENCP